MTDKDKNRKKIVKETYDTISEYFDSTRGYLWKECTDFIDRAPQSSRLLDIGCGNGRNCLYATQHGLNITGIDISSKLLSIVKSAFKGKNKEISLVQADAVNLPVRSEYFDSILFIAAIHHMPSEKERIESLEEISRVLKKSGRALVSAWALDQPRFSDMKTANGDVMLKWDKTYDRFYHLFSGGELEKLCLIAGFEIISSFRSKDNYYVEVSKPAKPAKPKDINV